MELQFQKIVNRPAKPLVVWDGECAFCHYWVTRLKNIIGDKLQYEPFQKIMGQFPEIPENEFRRSVKFIDERGNVFNGAAAAFKVLDYERKHGCLFRLYTKNKLFRKTSDLVYKKVSANRSFAYKLTRLLRGKDPRTPKPYWLFYALVFIALAKLIQQDKARSVKSHR